MRITGATGGGGNNQSGVLVGSSGAIGFYTFDNLAVVGNTGYGIAFTQVGGSVTDVDVTDSDLSNNAVGVRFSSALTTVTDVLVDDSTFTDNTFNGFIINPDGLASFSADDITITDSVFTNNGDGVSVGAGDVSLFVFNGDATLTNVSITTDSHIGLQIRGNAPFAPAGIVALTNVSIAGTPSVVPGFPTHTPIGLFIANYTDVSTISFSNVDIGVGGATTAGLLVDTTGAATLDLNDTDFTSAPGAYIGDVSITPVDATGATFGGVNGAGATFAQLFAIEDKVVHGVDLPGLGLVRVKAGDVYVTALSFLPPFTTTPSIQRGIDVASGGDTIYVQTGTVDPGSVDVNKPVTLAGEGTITGTITVGPGATVSPGFSPGIINSGSVTFDSTSTFTVELNGTTPGTGHDQLNVTGTVDLGGATLVASRGFNPTVGDTFVIINNDGVDVIPVPNRFAGLPEGATITLVGIPFTISYVGGVGSNDVTLTVANSADVWVNENWVEQSNTSGGTPGVVEFGDLVENTGGGDNGLVMGKIFGYDAFDTVIGGVAAVATSGTVHVLAGLYVEGPQVVISKDLSIAGEDKTKVTIQPGADTGSSGDSRGWFLVDLGKEFNIDEVTLDGNGFKVWQAIRHKGTGLIDNVVFDDIQFDASGPSYAGTAVAAFGGVGDIDVTNSTLSNIGRIGVLYFGPGTTGTFSGNTYTRKGVGDWLDYAVEVGNGASADIVANTITGNLGVASVDSSTSAGVLVTTFFGGGSQATITNNFITGNTTAVAVGFDGSDTSDVTVFDNDLSGNTSGVTSTAPLVDASGNWWGSNVAATVAGLATASLVDYTPWLDTGADSDSDPSNGFQGDFSLLHVDDDSPQTGATGRIQEGIDLLADGTLTGSARIVDVTAGTYAESQVLINKPSMVLGASQATTFIDGDSTPIATIGVVRINAAGDVTFDGFTVREAGAASGVRVGVYTESAVGGVTYNITHNTILGSNNPADTEDYGFYSFGGLESLVFQHNTVSQTGANSILLERHYGATGVSFNTFDRGVADDSVDAYFNMNYGGTDISSLQKVHDNDIDMGNDVGPFDNDHRGFGVTFASDFTSAGLAGSFTNVEISDNTIHDLEAFRRGIGLWNNGPGSGASGDFTGVTISGNDISGNDSAGSQGIRILGLATGVDIAGNTITDVDIGIRQQDWNGHAANGTLIHNDNEFTSSGTGILIGAGTATIEDNDNSIHGNAIGIDVSAGSATIDGNSIYNNGIGIRLTSGGAATIDNNLFNSPNADPDNAIDVQLTATAGSVTLGTLTGNDFAGDTYYIEDLSTQNLDAVANTFDETGGDANFRVEDRMHHRVDTDLLVTNGLITWVAGNLYVTDGGTDHSIQRGIDAATAGNIVNVEHGTYVEDVVVNKSVVLRGAQYGVDARGRVVGVPSPATETVVSPNIATHTFELVTGAAGATIDGFAFSGGSRQIESNTGPLHDLQLLNNSHTGFTGSGIFLDDPGDNITIDQNSLDGSSQTGSGAVLHLDTDLFRGMWITDNWIKNGAATGLFVDGNHNVVPSVGGGARNPLISGNLFDGNQTGANLGRFAFQFGTISLNVFKDSDFDGLQGGIQDSIIEKNTFTGNDRFGLSLTGFSGSVSGDSTRGAKNTTVRNNFFINNTGLPVSGDVNFNAFQFPGTISTNHVIQNSFTSPVGAFYNGTETIDVGFNWWNDDSGPSGGGHAGTGSAVAGTGAANLDVNPWLCVGTDVGGNPNDGFQPDLTMLCTDALAISGASNVDEGDLYTLTRSNNGDPDLGTIISWTIDWGDGPAEVVPGAFGPATHTYDDGLNNYVISATATNGVDTFTVINTVSVQVDNVAPSIALSGPTDTDEAAVYTLTLGAITDPGLDTVTDYRIDWGDGTAPDVYTAAQIALLLGDVTHTYADDHPLTATASDPFTITVDLRDEDSAPGFHPASGTKVITVHNLPPTSATIIGAPISSPEGTPITVSATVVDPSTALTETFTYNWSVTKNALPFASDLNSPSDTFMFTPDDDGAYVVSLTVVDDDLGGPTAALSQSITVTDVAPTIALAGANNVNEASLYSLTLGAVTDPGMDTVTSYTVFWGDGLFDTYGTPGVKTHTYSDDNPPGTSSDPYTITVTLVNEDGVHPGAGMKTINVDNVAPTASAINGGAVNEGSPGLVLVLGQSDVSAPDILAGFTYGYDFNNDGDFLDSGEIASTASSSAVVPGAYLYDDPSKTIRIEIRDDDNGVTSLFTTITINNVAPVVNAGPDTMAFVGIPWIQNGSFTDPGSEGVDLGDLPWSATVDYDTSDLNPAVPLALAGHNFTLNNTYTSPGVYTVTGTVDDHDGGVHTDFVQVTVNVNTFRVTGLTTTPSGFVAQFNRAADTTVLNIYDGIDLPADLPDITLVGNSVGNVVGSGVWDAATNTLEFVRTGGVLAADTYTLTLVSSANAFKDTLGGSLLDGDSDFVAGGNYVNAFVVSPSADRVVSLPDFARGATDTNGQVVNIPATGTGLPIRIDEAAGINAVDVDVVFDPTILSITAAALAPGMPLDWTITTNLITADRFKITISGITTLLSGPRDLIRLTANVPAGADYGESQVIQLDNLAVNAGFIAAKADRAVHKATFFGDASGDGFFTGADSALISRVVVALDSGFDRQDLTDPVIIADVNSTGVIDGLDASYVAQKSVNPASRPEIPDKPAGSVLPVAPGIDPELSIDLNIPVAAGGTVVVPIKVDDATGLYGFNVNVDYAAYTSLVDLADGFPSSPDVTLGGLFAGWSQVTFVDDANGHVAISLYQTVPMAGGAGSIVELTFHVSPLAPEGIIPLDLNGLLDDQGLTFTHVDGSLLIDNTAPRVTRVLAGSTDWTAAFRNQLVLSGTGTQNGYGVPTGAAQIDTLWFSNLNQVVVQFDEDVDIQQGDLTLTGVDVPLYGISGFSYDPLTFTAIWTTTQTIGNDKLTITLDGSSGAAVEDLAGNQLNGEWTNQISSYPSGVGLAGGDFSFRFNVLPADANQDGDVDIFDINLVSSNWSTIGPQGNINGDDSVDIFDINAISSNWGMVGGGAGAEESGSAESAPLRLPVSQMVEPSIATGSAAASTASVDGAPLQPAAGGHGGNGGRTSRAADNILATPSSIASGSVEDGNFRHLWTRLLHAAASPVKRHEQLVGAASHAALRNGTLLGSALVPCDGHSRRMAEEAVDQLLGDDEFDLLAPSEHDELHALLASSRRGGARS